MTGKFAVYALLVNREIAYVGMTKSLARRESEHRVRVGGSFGMRVLSWHETRREAAKAEREMILHHKPKLNRDHVLPRRTDPSKMLAVDEAKTIWRNRNELSNREVLKLMKGWTYAMAYDRFGARSRPENWK